MESRDRSDFVGVSRHWSRGLAVPIPMSGCLLQGQPVIGFRGSVARAPGAVWLNEHSRPEDVVLTASALNAVRGARHRRLAVLCRP